MQADPFLHAAWRQIAGEYRCLVLRGMRGDTINQIGNIDGRSAEPRGSLVLQASLDAPFPRDILECRVGSKVWRANVGLVPKLRG